VAAERLGALSLLPALLEAAGVDSRALILRRDEHGRPYCETQDGTPAGFDFNLSHSALHTAAALLTDGGRVGVDTEELIPTERALSLIRRYGTEGERALLQDMSNTEAAQAFTRIWTVREAVGKQEGVGMPLGFDAAKPPAGVAILPFTLTDTGGCVTLCVPQAAPPLTPQLLAGSVPLHEFVIGE
jgi:phosphopantetheinyl transferase